MALKTESLDDYKLGTGIGAGSYGYNMLCFHKGACGDVIYRYTVMAQFDE